MILQILMSLGYILIFPGFLFCSFVGLLLVGIDRKIVARMQKRVGPPVLQPFYDFFKLCGKETIIPCTANRTAFLLSPLVGLAAIVVLQLFIPIGCFTAFSSNADVILILYLLLMPAVAQMVGASSTGSPYAGVGLSREMVTIISCELPLVLVFLTVGKAAGEMCAGGVTFSLTAIVDYQRMFGSFITKPTLIPAAIAFLMVIPAETGVHPFDTAEAETEICEGMLAEYSGAPLAVFELTHAIKMLTLSSLFVVLFLGGITTGNIIFDVLIVVLLCIAITFISTTILNASSARWKINQVFKYYWTVVSGIALISMILVWLSF